MISVERVFQLLAPASNSLFRVRGKGIFTREDAIGLIALAEQNQPLGIKVLEAKISGNKDSWYQLVDAISRKLVCSGHQYVFANILAKFVVREVCGTQLCPKCRGTGETRSRRYRNRLFKCKACNGLGRSIVNSEVLLEQFIRVCGLRLSLEEFVQCYWSDYLRCIDELFKSQGDAELECKRLIRNSFGEA